MFERLLWFCSAFWRRDVNTRRVSSVLVVGSLISGLHRAPGGIVNCYVYSNVCVRRNEHIFSQGNDSDLQSGGVIAQDSELPGFIAVLTASSRMRRIYSGYNLQLPSATSFPNLEITHNYLLPLHLQIWICPTTTLCHLISKSGYVSQLPCATSFPNLDITHDYPLPLHFQICK